MTHTLFSKYLYCLSFSLILFLYVDAQKVDDVLQQILNETSSVGISAVVVKKGKVVYKNAVGYRDVENKLPLKEKHIFRIASISKSFSATSIMQLVESEQLDLDVDVSSFLGFQVRNPKYPDKKITLRLMMSHLSSINDSEGYFNLDVINPEKNQNWVKAYSDYAPGDSFLYCNLNYNMIGAIIERASNKRFDDYVIDNVLKPLGLYGGYNVMKLDSNQFAYIYEYKNDSVKYVRSNGAYAVRSELNDGYIFGRTTTAYSPTGGMKISAPDLAKYMMMHMRLGKFNGGRIISKQSALAMQKPVSFKEPYGFGLETSRTMIPGETLVGHTGVAYGLYSAMFFHPKKKYGIVVIINGCPPAYESGYNAVIRKTVNQLYDNFIKNAD